MTKRDPGPIFIVGCRRSGTTLMLDVLNQHPRIGLCPETHFIAELLKKLKKIDINKEIGKVSEILYSVYNIPYNPYWKKIPITKDTIQATLLEKRGDLDYIELFKTFMKLVAALQGKKRYGEKSPKHTFHVDTLKEWFPNAKIIQMVRDPRAVAASHVYRDAKIYREGKLDFPYFQYTLLKILQYWVKTAKLIPKYQNRYREDYVLVRYEDLVTNPEENIRRICDFIGEKYNEEMLKPSLFLSSFIQDEERGGFKTSSLEKWKKSMPRWSIFFTEFVCSRYMKRLGYKK